VRARALSGWRAGAATAICSVVVGLGFAAPLARLVGWAVGEAVGPRGTPLLERFAEFLANSLILAAVTGVLCVVVAVVVTNAPRFSRLPVTAAAARLATVGYGLPGPVVAIGVVLALVALDNALGLAGLALPGAVATGSFLGLVYAYVIRFLAPGIHAVEAGLGQVPEEVTAAARTLGARPLRVAGRTHLPLARTSVLTAAAVVAVDAVKELPIVLLLRPIGFDTLPVWTWNLASESRFEQAALPAIAIVGVALVPVVLLSRRLAVAVPR
jgi:iron(III) transport system permease protein